MFKASSGQVFKNLNVSFGKSHKQSSVIDIWMNFSNLAFEFFLSHNKASVNLNEMNPALLWGCIDYLIDFIQMETNYIISAEIRSLRHFIINISE